VQTIDELHGSGSTWLLCASVTLMMVTTCPFWLLRLSESKLLWTTDKSCLTRNSACSPGWARRRHMSSAFFTRVSRLCPATATCYHVIAAKMAVGLPIGDAGGRKVNLTQLRHNKCKRADKTSGRKCQRVHDVDVIPASDADDDMTRQLVTAVTGTPVVMSLPRPLEPELQELLPVAVVGKLIRCHARVVVSWTYNG